MADCYHPNCHRGLASRHAALVHLTANGNHRQWLLEAIRHHRGGDLPLAAGGDRPFQVHQCFIPNCPRPLLSRQAALMHLTSTREQVPHRDWLIEAIQQHRAQPPMEQPLVQQPPPEDQAPEGQAQVGQAQVGHAQVEQPPVDQAQVDQAPQAQFIHYDELINLLFHQNEQLFENLVKATDQIAVLSNQVSQLANRVTVLTGKVDQLDALPDEVGELVQRIVQAEDEITDLDWRVDQLDAQNKDLEEQDRELIERIDGLGLD